jgi:hypothetical protein
VAIIANLSRFKQLRQAQKPDRAIEVCGDAILREQSGFAPSQNGSMAFIEIKTRGDTSGEPQMRIAMPNPRRSLRALGVLHGL